MFVTHDRAFARRLANRVAELDRGRLFAFACGYDQFVERREALLEAEITRQALFDKKLAQEEVWIRQGIKARRTRNEGRVRALKKLREEYRQRRERQGTARMQLQEADRSGALVAEAEKISFAWDGKPLHPRLFHHHHARRPDRHHRPQRLGQDHPAAPAARRTAAADRRACRLGTRREVLYFDQLREQLDLDATVQENVGEGNDTVIINGKPRHVIGYLQDFLFSPERARSPVQHPLRRRAQPPAAGQALHQAVQRAGAWTNRPTTSMPRPWSCWRICWSSTPAPCCWSATTGSFSTTW